MLLTEKEARFKFCPLLKTSDDKMKCCQGSQCMFWRFKHLDRHSETDPGYCGIAGKPAGAM